MTSMAFVSSINVVTPSKKTTRLVRQNLLLVKPCRSWITPLFSTCFSIASQEDLPHDLPRHRGGVDRSYSSDCLGFSNSMESYLATTLFNSLRILGFISSGPIDLYIFRFLRCSQTWSSLTLWGSLLLQSLPCDPSTQEVWEDRLSVKIRAKHLLSTSVTSSIIYSLPALFIMESRLSLPFLFWLAYL